MRTTTPWMMLLLTAATACGDTAADESLLPDENVPDFSDSAMVIDFGNADGEITWTAVNDTVMGGVSDGTLSWTETSFVFQGEVSTDSNGGFTSVRSIRDEIDLSAYDRVLIRLRNEGQGFAFVIADQPLFFQNQFKVNLAVPDSEWHILEIPLSDFDEYAFVGGYPEATGEVIGDENLAEVEHFEFISDLFQPGAFRLEVDWVAFDRDAPSDG